MRPQRKEIERRLIAVLQVRCDRGRQRVCLPAVDFRRHGGKRARVVPRARRSATRTVGADHLAGHSRRSVRRGAAASGREGPAGPSTRADSRLGTAATIGKPFRCSSLCWNPRRAKSPMPPPKRLPKSAIPIASRRLTHFCRKPLPTRKPIAFAANITLAFRLLEQDQPAESAKILHTLEPLANEAGRCAILAGLVDAATREGRFVVVASACR